MTTSGRIFPTLREALHATATGAKLPMKQLPAELDWSPSEFSMRTTLGGESARVFPADDDHLVRLMRVTGDFSILATLAELCGFELQPKKERLGELLVEVRAELSRTQAKMHQLALELDEAGGGKGSRR